MVLQATTALKDLGAGSAPTQRTRGGEQATGDALVQETLLSFVLSQALFESLGAGA